MRTRIAESLAAAAAVTLLLCPARAAAQQQFDTNPPPPNVLILLDNSGSMERMIDGTIPENASSSKCNCDPVSGVCDYTYNPKPNRWNTVQTALTGDLTNGFNCVAMPRTSGSIFTNEYQIAGTNPYDTNYYLAFHRMVAKDTSGGMPVSCVVAPGVLPGTTTPGGVSLKGFGGGVGTKATDFTGAIIDRPYPFGPASTSSSSCQFVQLQNGAIPTMTNLMRFGLMTFDQDPSAATGMNPDGTVATSTACDNNGICGAFTGMWSYFPGWNTGGTCNYLGNPVNCTTPVTWAVGSRNPAAPPWEGRMVGFPTPTGDAVANNNNVQSVILASRPYGATPLDGMFYGAQYYLQTDPSGPGGPVSGSGDPLVQGGCRPEYIIVLTDGAPNYDMRPDCNGGGADAGTPGVCPFPKLPEEIAKSLYNNGQRVGTQQFVKTYVIGFAVSSFYDQSTLVGCSSLVSNGALTSNATTKCASTDPATEAAYGACCELQRIALNGGTNQAYFADSPGDLQKALGAILADIAKNATTRTTPAYSGVYTNAVANTTTPQTNASAYLASFNPSPGQPWSGNVQRQRYDCTYTANMSGPGGSFSVPTPKVDSSQGDDFAANLNSASAPGTRVYLAMQPDAVSGSTIDSTVTIRPYVKTTVADGLGKYGATTFVGAPTAVLPKISPDALNIPITGASTGCPYTPNNAPGTKYLGASDQGASCRNMLLDFTFGQSYTGPSDFTFVSRTANAFGDVFHATPIVVGPPAALLQDPSYVGFRATWGALVAGSTAKPREQIVYVATNDGLLHAFWADETKLENNERWAMLLPAAMPSLLSAYPSSHQFLLDGSPIVKDAVWERSNVSDATVWHTNLVAGYGPYSRGYYAVDVTNPDPSKLSSGASPPAADPDPSTGKPPGPVFLWQLTTMPATNYKIFGDHSATPAITTLFMDPDGTGAREIGVAILPGGVDKGGPTSSASSGPKCQRQSSVLTTTGAQPLDSNFAYRNYVRCWGPKQLLTDVVNGRSLSIVRLDTGEILRVFTRLSDVPTTDTLRNASPTRIIDTPLDSPMTGTPIVYPAEVGAIGTKVFVGDADGTLWRFDLSNKDPSQWVGEIFLDLYNNTVDPPNPDNWYDGQPFDVPPVLSVSSHGEVVLNVASGGVESFDANGNYFVYSITETVQGTAGGANPPKLRAFVNWWLGPNSTPVALRQGERVSGPMTVFNRTLYFATYFAGDPKAISCNNGSARLWGFDYVVPYNAASCPSNSATCGQGGVRRLQPPAPPPDFVDPTVTLSAPQGAVIPGVSIKATPACASLGSAVSDQYVAGGSHASTQNFTAGSYSLFAQIGAKAGSGAATQQVEIGLQNPASPTLIDSWAAVLE